ncbi:MAG: hypothetical protein PHW10_05280 [Candidatus Peribacteraceae bacterium]|nr:hypothetical protein [Candidatus Peribacteraceae bacterium]
MRADYHLHPNLLRKHPTRRLRKIWEAIAASNLDAVICAEHAFKDAPLAYRRLCAARPETATTHVFPGAELVATAGSRGIDVIAFGEEDWYDRHPRLLEPYGMPLAEMLAYLDASSDLRYFIPHPTLLGTPLLKLHPHPEEMRAFLARVPAFEAFNGSPLLLEHLCMLPGIRLPFGRFGRACRRGARLPLELFGRDTHRFFAVGSDAHHPSEIGFGVEIPGGPARGRADTFRRLVTNRDITTLYFPRFNALIPRLLMTAATTLREALTRTFLPLPSSASVQHEHVQARRVLAE